MTDKPTPPHRPLDASRAYYIKLGRAGNWETECLKDGTLRFGYRETPQDLCLRGDWQAVREVWNKIRGDEGTATRDVNQIRVFYEADETTLFVTFAGGLLYWCRPSGPVEQLSDGGRRRATVSQYELGRSTANDRPAVRSSSEGADVSRHNLRSQSVRLPAAQTR
jgi:hypothetical protein